MSNEVRLNKFLAVSGVAARRKADLLIEEGAVKVNGKTVFELGVKIHPEKDRVTVNGKPVKPVGLKIYIALYKPESVLTAMSDEHGRSTVADYLKKVPFRVFPVGRLDWDTEGLLLFTNDGDFSQKISHPKSKVPKTYLAKIDGDPTPYQLEKLKKGVTIPGGKVKALEAKKIHVGDSEKYKWIKIVITEGRNRQIRKMFEKIGFDVKKLKRVAIGELQIGNLRKGEMAFLGPKGVKEALSSKPAKEKSPSRKSAETNRQARPTRK